MDENPYEPPTIEDRHPNVRRHSWLYVVTVYVVITTASIPAAIGGGSLVFIGLSHIIKEPNTYTSITSIAACIGFLVLFQVLLRKHFKETQSITKE